MPVLPFDARTVLVTGVDFSVGYEIARRFATGGATVYLHAFDKEHGHDALEGLIGGGVDPARLHLVQADFTRLAEVRELGETLAATLPALDVLVNAAAIVTPEGRTLTEDRVEVTFQVNYLAAYVLTSILADRIAAAGGRVLNLSSKLHRGGSIDYEDLSRLRHGYAPLAIYAQSKLALTMFSRSLGDRTDIAAVSVYPGYLDTERTVSGRATTGSGSGEAAASGRDRIEAAEAARIVAVLSDSRTPVVDGAHYELLDLMPAAALVANPRARARLAKLSRELTAVAEM